MEPHKIDFKNLKWTPISNLIGIGLIEKFKKNMEDKLYY